MPSPYYDREYSPHPPVARPFKPAGRPLWLIVLVALLLVLLVANKRKPAPKQPDKSPQPKPALTEQQEHDDEADVLRRIRIDHDQNLHRPMVQAAQDILQ